MICPHCGNTVSDTARYCMACGTDLALAALDPVCPGCGNQVAPGMSYCKTCGTFIGDLSENTYKTNVCSNCGGVLNPGVRFCAHCGAPADGASSQSPAATAPIPGTADKTQVYPGRQSPAPQYGAPEPVYAQPYDYAAPAVPQKRKKSGKGLAIAGLVIGIIGLVGWFGMRFVGLIQIPVYLIFLAAVVIASIVGVVLAAVGIGKGEGGTRVMAIIGLILCVLSVFLIISGIVNLLTGAAISTGLDMLNRATEGMDINDLGQFLEMIGL